MARKENPLPAGDAATLPIGARLRLARRQRGLSLQQLADQLGYTKPYLSAVENGTAPPSAAIVAAYARALELAGDDQPVRDAAVVGALRVPDVSVATSLDAVIARIGAEFGLSLDDIGTISALLIDDAESKARSLRSSLDWWRHPGPIEVCCMPVAGWQWREWPFDQIVAAIGRGTAEAMQARIREVVVILPPDKIPEIERAVHRSPFAERLQSIRCVGQHAPLGLGHAILQAAPVIGARPFAILLPDDRFDRIGAEPAVLQQLVDQYSGAVDHIVAVAKLKGQGRQYGLARLEAGRSRRAHRGVELLVEKPEAGHPIFGRDPGQDSGAVYSVVGRYVLAPSIMTALAALSRAEGAGSRIELLDALQWLIDRERESVAAYVLPSLVQLERDQTVFVAGAPLLPPGFNVA